MKQYRGSGKTAVLTGATSGIGRATALQLAGEGVVLFLTGRSEERCKTIREEIRTKIPESEIFTFSADLSSQTKVKKLAEEIRSTLKQLGRNSLDLLINNAAEVSNWHVTTVDGYEQQFAVNHLAPFLLTRELMSFLENAKAGRIITTSSKSHRKSRIRWEDPMFNRKYSTLAAYKQSKLANVLFTAELNRRLAERGTLRAFAADPGLVNTSIGEKNTTGLVRIFWRLRRRKGVPPEKAAEGIVFLALHQGVKEAEGFYWKDCSPVRPDPAGLDPEAAERLWNLSKRFCGIEEYL